LNGTRSPLSRYPTAIALDETGILEGNIIERRGLMGDWERPTEFCNVNPEIPRSSDYSLWIYLSGGTLLVYLSGNGHAWLGKTGDLALVR